MCPFIWNRTLVEFIARMRLHAWGRVGFMCRRCSLTTCICVTVARSWCCELYKRCRRSVCYGRHQMREFRWVVFELGKAGAKGSSKHYGHFTVREFWALLSSRHEDDTVAGGVGDHASTRFKEKDLGEVVIHQQWEVQGHLEEHEVFETGPSEDDTHNWAQTNKWCEHLRRYCDISY